MSNNEVLTPEFVDWVGTHASLVSLCGTVKGVDPHFDLANCVARFKQRWPDLPVLVTDIGWGPGGRVNTWKWADVARHPEWQIGWTSGGKSGDATNPQYRAFLAGAMSRKVGEFGCDGIAFDFTPMRLWWANAGSLKGERAETARLWSTGRSGCWRA